MKAHGRSAGPSRRRSISGSTRSPCTRSRPRTGPALPTRSSRSSSCSTRRSSGSSRISRSKVCAHASSGAATACPTSSRRRWRGWRRRPSTSTACSCGSRSTTAAGRSSWSASRPPTSASAKSHQPPRYTRPITSGSRIAATRTRESSGFIARRTAGPGSRTRPRRRGGAPRRSRATASRRRRAPRTPTARAGSSRCAAPPRCG